MANSISGYTKDIIPEKVVYTGKETSTATTIVDNISFEIGVEVKDSAFGDKIENKDGTISIKRELGSNTTEIGVALSDQEGNILSEKEDGLYASVDTDTFAKKSDLNRTNAEVETIKRDYASKEWVNDKDFLDQDDLSNIEGLIDEKQDVLTAGENITITKYGDATIISSTGKDNYNDLANKPSINGVVLVGDKTTED